MNDENMNQDFSGDTGLDPEKLNAELEELRECFQEKYDETVEEVNNPVIQDLEENIPEEESEDDENPAENESAAEKPKKKKKGRAVKAIIIAVVIVALLSIIAVLGAGLGVVIAAPDVLDVFPVYSAGMAGEDYEARLKSYEEALEMCDEDNMVMKALANVILEDTVMLIAENEGYAAAYSYMKSNMSEEQISRPVGGDFRKFLKLGKKTAEAAYDALDIVIKNTGDLAEVPDNDVLSKGLNIPEEVYEDFCNALKTLSEAYILDRAAKTLDDRILAVNNLGGGYASLVSLGADSRMLAESFCTDLYDNGFIAESILLSAVAINPGEEAVTEEYKAFLDATAALKSADVKVYDIIEAVKNGTDPVKAVKDNSSLTDDVYVEIIAEACEYGVTCAEAREEKNLTEAYTRFSTLISTLNAYGLKDTKLYFAVCDLLLEIGDLTELKSVAETFFTEDAVNALSAEEKAQYDSLAAILSSLDAASEVFASHYSVYYQTGEMDYAAVKKDLEALITEESTDYDKVFVNYFLCYSSFITEDSGADIIGLLNEMYTLAPELLPFYGTFYLGKYEEDGNITAAKRYADMILEINVADEYANTIVSLYHRINKDYDKAVEAALKGIELNGSSVSCSKQAGIACLLKGDLESAYGYLYAYYSGNMTVDACDYILLIDHLYEGEDEEFIKTVDANVAEIEQMFTYYGASSLDDTKAILDGTKTPEEVFLGGNYDIY